MSSARDVLRAGVEAIVEVADGAGWLAVSVFVGAPVLVLFLADGWWSVVPAIGVVVVIALAFLMGVVAELAGQSGRGGKHWSGE